MNRYGWHGTYGRIRAQRSDCISIVNLLAPSLVGFGAKKPVVSTNIELIGGIVAEDENFPLEFSPDRCSPYTAKALMLPDTGVHKRGGREVRTQEELRSDDATRVVVFWCLLEQAAVR